MVVGSLLGEIIVNISVFNSSHFPITLDSCLLWKRRRMMVYLTPLVVKGIECPHLYRPSRDMASLDCHICVPE
jgi:hypothetical protein